LAKKGERRRIFVKGYWVGKQRLSHKNYGFQKEPAGGKTFKKFQMSSWRPVIVRGINEEDVLSTVIPKTYDAGREGHHSRKGEGNPPQIRG